MPAPLLLPLITAGATLAGQGINAATQSANNRKSRQWNEMMYAKQRQDSLSDWAMQNEYNSPQKQMERLRNAGLNPNLVYGSGAVANSAQQVKQTDVKSWSPQAPQFQPEQALTAFQDTKIAQAQYDNLTTNRTIMLGKIVGQALDNRKKAVDADIKEATKQTAIQASQAGLDLLKERKILTETQQANAADDNARKWDVHNNLTLPAMKIKLEDYALSLKEREAGRQLKEEEIKRVKQAVINMEKSGKLLDLQINLTKNGLQNAPWWIKAGKSLLDDIF